MSKMVQTKSLCRAIENMAPSTMNMFVMVISKTPIDYGMSCSYSRGNLYVELQAVSPFKKQEKRYWLDLPIYSYSKSIKDQTASQYASIKVAYSFDFGRKTQKVEKDVNKNINSSLLRVE